ncbi:elongation factor 1-gamma-like [Trifolium medium]|uniref:Elongation factor 1-gamma-like n=1 Tax=Trifolium medium TaxID=97028 RepID=A0A392NF38_9FABA|nr:elongation factor 1-gamma-like [Trifolium medium]
MYNPDTCSLWFCDSKYNAENSVTFKVGRFVQHMNMNFADQYAFGKMLVFGSKVKGLWLFNGQAIPKGLFDECYDMKLYEWTKVDISDEAQKVRVNQMIEDCEDFEGETIREIYFKY